MGRICLVLITAFLVNTAYSESSFNPKNHFEFGGDISYAIDNIGRGKPTQTSLHVIPITQYYCYNWFYIGPSMYYKSYKYNVSVNPSERKFLTEFYEGIGLKVGLMGNLGFFIYPCLELGATLDFFQYSLMPISEGSMQKYFEGVSFPVSFIGKIPLSQSLLLNINTTLFQGITRNDNVDFVFCFGLSGILKNEIVSILK